MVYVKVFLEDINDNRPVFYPLDYAASISTQSMPGTAVLRVTAHDKDEGMHGKVTYRIVLGNSPPLFSLNKDTGESELTGARGSTKQSSVVQEDVKTGLRVTAWPLQLCRMLPECLLLSYFVLVPA